MGAKAMTSETTGTTVSAVEVILSWEGTALDSEVIALGSATMRLVVGPSESARFLLPAEAVGEGFELVTRENERFALRIPVGASARITKDGAAIDASSLAIETGERVLALDAGVVAEVTIGEFSFFVRPLASRPERTARSPLIDWSAWRWVGAALAVHVALLLMLLASPPDASALNLDLSHDDVRYMRVQLDAIERDQPPPLPVSTSGAAGASEAGEPSPSSAASAGGTTATPRTAGGPGRRDPGRRTVVSHAPTASDVLALGTLQVAAAFSQIEGGASDSPYGSDQLEGIGGPGTDREAGGIGTLFGGLDMTHRGVGTCTGSHCSDHAIATGPLTTRDGNDIGDSTTVLVGTHTARVPRLRSGGETTVAGGLSREDVRRTIRNHISEVRFCYEQDLQSRPDLEGRVAVSFIVQPTGGVQAAMVQSSSPGTERVASCVSHAVQRWTFPRSEGMTAVTYPFVLQSQ